MNTRSIIQLALVALVLFGVSAALSVWLNQSRTGESENPDKEPKSAAAPNDEKQPEKAAPKISPKDEKGTGPESPPAAAVADVRSREERLERRQAQMDLVLRDLQAERDAVDALLRRVTAEAQAAAAAAREAATAPPAAKLPDPTAADPDAIRRMAAMYDNMTPESAALILKQMADGGKLDTAVRILAQMQPRQASRVLAEIEPELAAQLLEKMRTLKRAAPPATPAPAAGVTSNVPTAAAPPAAPPRTPAP
jgi:flagellar motility protein MotE (MotC chaperone)